MSPSTTDINNKKNNLRKWSLFILSFISVCLSSGLIYGWPTLRRNLIDEYNTTLSEDSLGLIYTIGAWSTQGGRLLFGLARDKFGTRNVCLVSLFGVICGLVGVAVCDANNATSLSISVFCIGLGSGGQLCLQPVASLFDRSGTIIASLSGAFQVSGLMFLVALSITSNKTHAFLGLASVIFSVAIIAWFMLPVGSSFVLVTERSDNNNAATIAVKGVKDHHNLMQIPRSELSTHSSNAKGNEHQSGGVNNNEEDVESLDSLYSSKTEESLDALPPLNSSLTPISPTNDTASNSRSCEVLVNVNTSEDKKVEERWEDDDKNMNTSSTAVQSSIPTTILRTKLHRILTILIQKEYLALICWFSLLIVPLQYYIGTIGYQLEKLGDDGYYTNIFSITYASAAALAPFGGYLSDRLGLGLTQGLATSLSAASFYFLAVGNLQSQIFGMSIYSVGRLLIFGMYFANISKRFGYTNYGLLAGLGLMVTAIVSLLQYPLITLVTNGYARQVNIICGTVLLVVGLPYCLWLSIREKKDEQQQQNEVSGEDTTVNEATTTTRRHTRATPTRQSSLFRASFIRKPSYFAQ